MIHLSVLIATRSQENRTTMYHSGFGLEPLPVEGVKQISRVLPFVCVAVIVFGYLAMLTFGIPGVIDAR